MSTKFMVTLAIFGAAAVHAADPVYRPTLLWTRSDNVQCAHQLCSGSSTSYKLIGLTEANLVVANEDVHTPQGAMGLGFNVYNVRAWQGHHLSDEELASLLRPPVLTSNDAEAVGASNASVLTLSPWHPFMDNDGGWPDSARPVADMAFFPSAISRSGLIAGVVLPKMPGSVPSDTGGMTSVPPLSTGAVYVSAAPGAGWRALTHASGTVSSRGVAVNDAGVVVGYGLNAAGQSRAIFTKARSNALSAYLPFLAASSRFDDVNASGLAVGSVVYKYNLGIHVVAYDTNKGTARDLGKRTDSGLIRVNNLGQITEGNRVYNPTTKKWVVVSVLNADGTVSPFKGVLQGINDAGNLIGDSFDRPGLYFLSAKAAP
jgi:hypothetical protein